jgi:3-hydroxyacyl-[acyl-carrier-protein] dehydratase
MAAPDLSTLIERLPHRPPFRFLTAVGSLDRDSGDATWEVTGIEDFLRGHFPGQPIVPGVLLIESLAQLSGLVALHAAARDTEAPSGRLAHVDVRFDRAVIPPAVIRLRVALEREIGALRQFSVRATVQDQPAARGTITIARIDGGGV